MRVPLLNQIDIPATFHPNKMERIFDKKMSTKICSPHLSLRLFFAGKVVFKQKSIWTQKTKKHIWDYVFLKVSWSSNVFPTAKKKHPVMRLLGIWIFFCCVFFLEVEILSFSMLRSSDKMHEPKMGQISPNKTLRLYWKRREAANRWNSAKQNPFRLYWKVAKQAICQISPKKPFQTILEGTGEIYPNKKPFQTIFGRARSSQYI